MVHPNDLQGTPFDRWALARLIVGRDLEGQGRRVSPRFRELVRQLECTPTEGRQQVWDDHLAALPEGDSRALLDAVAEANPHDPPPEEDGWGRPFAYKLPPVEPFPLDVFPPAVVRLILEAAKAIGCPPDYVA